MRRFTSVGSAAGLIVLAVLGAGRLEAAEREETIISVREQVSVEAESTLRLDQVADLTGPLRETLSSIRIGRTPGPGRRVVIARAAIERAISEAGIPMSTLLWQGRPQVRIHALGQSLDHDLVEKAILDGIAAMEGESEEEIRLVSLRLPNGPLLPPGDYRVRFVKPPSGFRPGTQRLPIEVIPKNGSPRRLSVVARMEVLAPVMVARRHIRSGEKIRPVDLKQEIRPLPTNARFLRTPSEARGTMARSTLREGQPVRVKALAPALAIEAGEVVKALLREGGVSLVLDTVARTRGDVGMIITVDGIDGRQGLRGRVVAPGRVVVIGSDPVAETTEGSAKEKEAE